MATVRITGITLSCTPGAQFNTLIEYKLTSDVGWTSAGNKLTNTNGTFTTPLDITGLDEGECYDFRFTPGIANACPLIEEFCTAPSPIWVALTQDCETEGGFGIVKTITGLSSPFLTWWDAVQERLYYADIDDPAGNIAWFTDIDTATTVADVTHSAAVTFDPIYNGYFDELYRRIYLVGADTNGLIVYDIDADSMSTVAFGSNGPFQRTALYVFGNLIICNNGNDDVILIARDTLTINTTVPTAGITNPEHFDNGPYIIEMVGSSLYVVSSNADADSVGVYDTSLNHITEIVLPGAATWSFANYWQSIFYDATSDKLFVSDTGSRQRFVIDPDTNTVIDTREYTDLEDKSNCAFSFSVDPLTNTLYASYSAQNDSSDSSPRERLFRVDRTTYDFTHMFENVAAARFAGIPDHGWFIGCDPNVVSYSVPNTGYDTDGTVTVFSNTVGSLNTGNVVVLTIQEVLMPGNIPTGGVKPNVPSDPDYIAPFLDTDICPITFSLACPTDAIFTYNDNNFVVYEFSLANAVRFNPAIDNIIVYWRINGTRQASPQVIADPTVSNYYTGTFTPVATSPGDVVDVEVVYRDASNIQLAFCVIS